MGASWRNLPSGQDFNRVIELIEAVSNLGLEVCCTLGMITATQAKALKAAGLHTYNHNIDTSPEYYEQIISTRTYQDRLDTLQNIGEAGIRVCSGGIIGMGESIEDRLRFLAVLASRRPQPDSVPINTLVPIEGTPLGEKPPVDPLDLVRMVATTRLSIPKAMVRLSAGRKFLTEEGQTLCFIAGANSIHTGDKLLTTSNIDKTKDHLLLEKLGMRVYQGREE